MKYRFHVDLTGEMYNKLIDVAHQERFSFSVVMRENYDVNESAIDILRSLPDTTVGRQQSWPGTVLLRDYARVYTGAVTQQTTQLLKKPGSIFSWRHPNWPEDLALYKGDEVVLFGVSHESFGCVDFSYLPSSFRKQLTEVIGSGGELEGS